MFGAPCSEPGKDRGDSSEPRARCVSERSREQDGGAGCLTCIEIPRKTPGDRQRRYGTTRYSSMDQEGGTRLGIRCPAGGTWTQGGASRAIYKWRADLAPPSMPVLEGDEGGSLVQNELSGQPLTTPTPMCGTAPPKPRLWIYEKAALVPQPESGLALFSSLEGVRTWFGGKVC